MALSKTINENLMFNVFAFLAEELWIWLSEFALQRPLKGQKYSNLTTPLGRIASKLLQLLLSLQNREFFAKILV